MSKMVGYVCISTKLLNKDLIARSKSPPSFLSLAEAEGPELFCCNCLSLLDRGFCLQPDTIKEKPVGIITPIVRSR